MVQPGEFFGELALVHPDRLRIGRACALEPSETLVLYRHDFEARATGVTQASIDSSSRRSLTV